MHRFLSSLQRETIICINIFLSISVYKCKSCALHTKSRYSDFLSGDQHWVPVKDMETCHGLCSLGLGFWFSIVCSAQFKAYFKKGNGKAPTDCKEGEVWPLVSNKSSVKAGAGSSLGLICAAKAHSHPALHTPSSSQIYRLCGKAPTSHCMVHSVTNELWVTWAHGLKKSSLAAIA